ASPTVEVGGATGVVVDGQMDLDAPAVVASTTDDELGDEREIRKREAEELAALVHPDLTMDVGANVTGVYELVGENGSFALQMRSDLTCCNAPVGMVTHKGPSADSGHYIGFARADVVIDGNE